MARPVEKNITVERDGRLVLWHREPDGTIVRDFDSERDGIDDRPDMLRLRAIMGWPVPPPADETMTGTVIPEDGG